MSGPVLRSMANRRRRESDDESVEEVPLTTVFRPPVTKLKFCLFCKSRDFQIVFQHNESTNGQTLSELYISLCFLIVFHVEFWFPRRSV